MSFRSLLFSVPPRPGQGRPPRASSRPARRRLGVEALDDRVVPARLSVGDAVMLEGNAGVRYADVRVSLDTPANKTVTVNYGTAAGTALAGSDYQASSGGLTFAPGETTKTVRVPVIGDRLAEPGETFSVRLSGARGAKIADGTGVVTIGDDEPRLRIGDASVVEGSSGATLLAFTISLSSAYDETVTVNYATADGTATTADNDYVATSGTLTVAPGETTKAITIEVGSDVTEGGEYFWVNLSGASSNALIIAGQGYGHVGCGDHCNPEPQYA